MNRIATAAAVRPGEGRIVALLAGTFAAVEAGRGMGQMAVDALVLNRLGADALPPIYVVLGLVGLVVTLVYGALLARTRPDRLYPPLVLGIAAVVSIGPLLILAGVTTVYPAMWIVVTAAGMLLVTITWSVAGGVLDARQAKRLFPLCTAAAIGGGFVGLLLAGPLLALVGPAAPVLVEVALLVVAAGLLRSLPRRSDPPPSLVARSTSIVRELGAGASWVARSPLMRLVAVAYVLFSVVLFMAAKPYLGMLRSSFPGDAATATANGLIAAVITALSFVVAVTLANRAYARLGVATVALVLPVLYLAGFTTWLLSFTLATAVAAQVIIQTTQRGLSNAAWSAMFGVVPPARRLAVLAFIDGVPGQLGTIASGLLLIVADRLGGPEGFLIGATASALLVAAVWGIRRRYGESLVLALRQGLAEQVLSGGRGLGALASEPGVVAGLVARTRLDDAVERRLAAELLGELGATAALPDLERLAADPDPQVRRSAIVAAARCGGGRSTVVVTALGDEAATVRAASVDALAAAGALELIDAEGWHRLAADPSVLVRGEAAVAAAHAGMEDRARPITIELLDDPDPVARTAGLDVLARCRPHDEDEACIAAALDDPAAAVRAAAIRATAARWRPVDGIPAADDPVVRALGDQAALVRETAATALRARPGASHAAVAVLGGGPDAARDAALSALDGHGPEVRAPLRAWAEDAIERVTMLRESVAALDTVGRAGPVPVSADASFLAAILQQRSDIATARLVRVLALLAGSRTADLVGRCLRSPDPGTRAQAIEAIDALGEGALARSVIRLLEVGANRELAPELGVIPVCRRLAADPDPWVRAMAMRTLAGLLGQERDALLAVAGSDPDPVVQAALTAVGGGADMAAVEALDEIGRMLRLRRVPLFAALGAEDLQRVAASSAERSWAGGDHLMDEGDLGDELVVIVEGTVRVVHERADGDILLRSCGPGDHIGELAVLRAAPRAATVIADDPSVRGLVIGGAAVEALLRERPDAAMAMLATLADRIGRQ